MIYSQTNENIFFLILNMYAYTNKLLQFIVNFVNKVWGDKSRLLDEYITTRYHSQSIGDQQSTEKRKRQEFQYWNVILVL